MDKKTLLLIPFILLCACTRSRQVACSRYEQENSLTLNIYAENDSIRMIEAIEIYLIPQQLLADEVFSADLFRQFDGSCRMEENRLIRSYGLVLDDRYSLSATVEELEKQRYHCE